MFFFHHGTHRYSICLVTMNISSLSEMSRPFNIHPYVKHSRWSSRQTGSMQTDFINKSSMNTGFTNISHMNKGQANQQTQLRGALLWLLIATSFGFVVVQLDVTIVNVALPQIGSALHAGVAGLQWVVDAYTLSFAALLISAGVIGDRFG